MTALLDRRGAMTVVGGAMVAACAGPRIATPQQRPLGLANITVRRELNEDYAGTLRKIAAMGYTHFGFPIAQMSPQMPIGPSPQNIAAMVRDAGLEVGVVRYGLASPAGEQMAAAAEIGASIIAYTAAPVFFEGKELGTTTRNAFDAWLPDLRVLSDEARAAGLKLAYHNHFWDHRPLGGETPLDIIARTYSPAEVAFEIDLAWALLGGENPVDLVRRLGPRVVSTHLKDVDRARGQTMFDQLVAPGEGELEYANLIQELDRLTNAIGYVEVDNPADGLQAALTGARAVQAARAAKHG